MRVLFIPLHNGGLPHCGPLIALSRMCAGASIHTAFLLPARCHGVRHAAGIEVLNIDHQNTMRSELHAYRLFRPDLVVDDCSLTTHYAAAVWGIPRVSIVRTGTFPGYVPLNPEHRFSLRVDLDRQESAFIAALNLPRVERTADFFRGSRHLIPGIPTIERLPAALQSSPECFYTGPLLLDDDCIERIVQATDGTAMPREPLQRFCEGQRGRPLAFFTFGNVHTPTPEIRECMHRLVTRGVAVISTITMDCATPAERELYHHASYVPMHYVTAQAGLMVHQCGSATYHYGLVHEVPTITVGSRCFDRDDVAVRLEALGVSRHVQDPADEPDFVERFMTLSELALADGDRAARLARVRALKDEIDRTRAAFSMAGVLAGALRRAATHRSGPGRPALTRKGVATC